MKWSFRLSSCVNFLITLFFLHINLLAISHCPGNWWRHKWAIVGWRVSTPAGKRKVITIPWWNLNDMVRNYLSHRNRASLVKLLDLCRLIRWQGLLCFISSSGGISETCICYHIKSTYNSYAISSSDFESHIGFLAFTGFFFISLILSYWEGFHFLLWLAFRLFFLFHHWSSMRLIYVAHMGCDL